MNLEIKEHRAKLAAQIVNEVDEFCKEKYSSNHRKHLGASSMGDECNRKLWYGFRWVQKQDITGTQSRLFQRGHREEEHIIKYLQGIGFLVRSVDNRGKQFTVEDKDNSHFGGSMDSIGSFPLEYNIKEQLIYEYKTYKRERFDSLIKNGVIENDLSYFKQMCIYGYKKNINYCLFYATCKDSDRIHIEIVLLDHNVGKMEVARNLRIVNSEIPPAKISVQPSYFKCGPKWCDKRDICHFGKDIEVNCRSCKFAKPVENKEWFCKHWDKIIPDKFIKDGCREWVSCNEI